ncbi:hypothetical protein PG996_007366 [Apiospora saccharicola]|uniref:PAS domain-containing protein n=1 Tax=Apiospora saccharicola TaxID=335842 RepID=A0ABR1VE21_9PEZI
MISESAIHVFGYPSDQVGGTGAVALEDTSTADFDFLSLDRLTRGTFTATTTRLSDQDAENTFCRCTLLLGGRRWPSLDRFRLILNAVAYDSLAIEWTEDGTAPTPTSEERGSAINLPGSIRRGCR